MGNRARHKIQFKVHDEIVEKYSRQFRGMQCYSIIKSSAGCKHSNLRRLRRGRHGEGLLFVERIFCRENDGIGNFEEQYKFYVLTFSVSGNEDEHTLDRPSIFNVGE